MASAILPASAFAPMLAFAKQGLPLASQAYDGMEPDAAWRTQAFDRIEKLRRANYRLMVKDSAGNTVPGAPVKTRLYRHHFGFGAAVQAPHLFAIDSAERQQFYQRITSEYFHRVTIANGLKWKHYQRLKPEVDRFLDWCVEQDLPVRGHCLVWPKFQRIPKSLAHLRNDKEALKLAIEEHIIEFSSKFGDPLIEWDVLNEPRSDREFMDILGDEIVDDWFRLVEKHNPNVTRYINEYNALTRNNPKTRKIYFDYIKGLLARNVPVQGIGFQSHIPEGYAPTPPRELLETMDKFASLGLELQVTEFDFETKDENLQAQYTLDFMIAVFSHPAMTGLVTWTPFEYVKGKGPKPDAAFFDSNLREKPNGRIWNQLVNQVWTTSVEGKTDANGELVFRGYKGTYLVDVENNNKTRSFKASLVSEGSVGEINL
jgi:GH35 family endo-1,4-beta-xylanase